MRSVSDMMSYKQWLSRVMNAAQHIASKEYQEKAWLRGGEIVSSPDEIYLTLMEDCTADLFIETYGKSFNSSQIESWNEFRSLLESYYHKVPTSPDPRRVLDDPEWDLVRQAAQQVRVVLRQSRGPALKRANWMTGEPQAFGECGPGLIEAISHIPVRPGFSESGNLGNRTFR
jgi:hypothetical protein